MDSTDTPANELLQWVQRWRRTDTALAAIKRSELEKLHTPTALAQLAEAFDMALRTAPTRLSSGLVEQQRYYRKLRRRGCRDR
jgi:hypothetical protein